MKKILTIAFLFCMATFAQAQLILDYSTIEEIVKNEKTYFNDIVELFNNDDPYIDVDDVALVYYGQAFLPTYNPGKDANAKKMRQYFNEDNYPKVYETAKNILQYNPVSLDALFYAWISSKTIGKSEDEYLSYVNKHQAIIEMIKTYGDGKSSSKPFRIIDPEDLKHVMLSLNVEDEISREFDTETLCNVIIVQPSREFQARRMYFDISLYLNNVSK